MLKRINFWQIILIGCLGFLLSIFLFHKGRINAQSNTVYVRENIATFIQSPQKLASLQQGIQVMKSRPANDPTSWSFQANIHGFPTGTTIPNNQAREVWATCQHGGYFFFPWHRMYVYYFERILRQASGDPTLALPYWDYSGDISAQRSIPEPFRIPAATSNPLYTSLRDSSYNSGKPLPTALMSLATAFGFTNFDNPRGESVNDGGRTVAPSFGGQQAPVPVPTPSSNALHKGIPHGELESKPHDAVHGLTGGRGGLMAAPETAAEDPIFWIHHSNIERLWESWLQQGGGRANPQPGTPDGNTWLSQNFTFFDVDQNGNPIQVTHSVSDFLNTSNPPPTPNNPTNGPSPYTYDDFSLAADRNEVQLSRKSVVKQAMKQLNRGDNYAQLQRTFADTQLQVARAAKNREDSIVLSDVPLTLTVPFENIKAEPLTAQSRILLNLEGVEFNPLDYIPYEIYINLPEGTPPDTESPYLVGVVSLFAYPQRATYSINITNEVRELQRRNLITGDSISLTFVPPPSALSREVVTEGPAERLQGAIRFKRITITRSDK